MATARTYSPGDEPVPGSGYRLVSFLGRGGFGEVWKATAPGGAEAALKIIRFGGKEGRKEFRALQLVKCIRHPHLVPIIGFWLKREDGTVLDDAATLRLSADDTPRERATATMLFDSTPAETQQAAELIIAMGLGSQSLMDRLEQCRTEGRPGIPPPELLRYLEDTADALDFLNSSVHELGDCVAAIQHCDIKPQNLMIVAGRVQVCDFGLARMLGAERATTAAASIAYAAPECLFEGTPSAATDQYSLAISYYELKTGQLPFADQNLGAMMQAKRGGELDFSRVARREQAVLRRATATDPKGRFASCREMVDTLTNANRAGPSGGEGAKVGRRLLALVLALTIIGGGAWLAINRPWQQAGAINGSSTNENGDSSSNKKPDDTGGGKENSGTKPVGMGKTNGEKRVEPPQPSPASLELAEQHFQRGEFRPALEQYNAAIAAGSATAAAYFGRARTHLKLGDAANALRDLERAQEMNPAIAEGFTEFSELYLERGTAALKQNNYGTAVADLERAVQLDPRNYRAFSRLGAAWARQGKWDTAVEKLSAALHLQPHELDYYARGRAYRRLGKADEAIADFKKAVELKSDYAVAYLALGDVYLDKDRPREAVEALDRAIDVAGPSPPADFSLPFAHLLRATAHLLAGNYDLAASDLDQVVADGNDSERAGVPDLLSALAEAYAEARQYSKAAAAMEKAIPLAPDDAKADYRRRLERYQAGRP